MNGGKKKKTLQIHSWPRNTEGDRRAIPSKDFNIPIEFIYFVRAVAVSKRTHKHHVMVQNWVGAEGGRSSTWRLNV